MKHLGEAETSKCEKNSCPVFFSDYYQNISGA